MKDRSLRVLIIEDSEDEVLFLIHELKKGGYNPVYDRVETAAAMEKSLKEKQWEHHPLRLSPARHSMPLQPLPC